MLAGLFAVALATAGSLRAQEADFVVVINAVNPTQLLSRQEIARMFLKQRNRWDHGERVRPVDLSELRTIREQFSLEVFRRRTIDIEDHWRSLVFSGRDVPPTEKASEVEVLEYVAANPGAIGYVARSTPLPPGIKVLEIVD
jgi:ABC-type phosphate transport system substrate-binding protein